MALPRLPLFHLSSSAFESNPPRCERADSEVKNYLASWEETLI